MISFDEVAQLFDRDRRKTCLETSFTSHVLLHFIHGEDVEVNKVETVSLEAKKSRIFEDTVQQQEEYNRKSRQVEDKLLSLEVKLTKGLDHVMGLLHNEQQKVKCLREQLAAVKAELALVQARKSSAPVASSGSIQTPAKVTAVASQNPRVAVNVLEREPSKGMHELGELYFLFQQLRDRLSTAERSASEARERMVRAELRARNAESAVQSMVKKILSPVHRITRL